MSEYKLIPEENAIRFILEPPEIRNEVLQRMTDDKFTPVASYEVPIVQADDETVTLQGCWKVINALRHLTPPNYDFGDLYLVREHRTSASWARQPIALIAPIQSRGMIHDIEVAKQRTNVALPTPFPHVTVAIRPDAHHPWHEIAVPSSTVWDQLRSREPYATNWQQKIQQT